MRKWLDDRLRELKAKGKTKAGLASALGIAATRISEIIKGDRGIDALELKPMADYLEWSQATLLAHITGDGRVLVEVGTVPVVGVVQAGLWQEAMEWDESDWYAVPAPVQKTHEGLRKWGLEVRGPSMNEIYPPGSIVICVKTIDLGKNPENGQRVVVQRTSSHGIEATIKELRVDQDGVWWLWPRSTDPNFQQPWRLPSPPDQDGSDDEIRIVAVVVASYRPE
jgi:repressor LexA